MPQHFTFERHATASLSAFRTTETNDNTYFSQRSQGFQSFSDSLRQLPALHLSSRLDLSSHLLLSICCYVIRGYVAPCILHGIFCFIISYSITRMMHIPPHTTLTHMRIH